MTIANEIFENIVTTMLKDRGYDTSIVKVPTLESYVICKGSHKNWENDAVIQLLKKAYVLTAVDIASAEVGRRYGVESTQEMSLSAVSIVNDCITVFNLLTSTVVYAVSFNDVDMTTMNTLVTHLVQSSSIIYERLGNMDSSTILMKLAITYGSYNKTSDIPESDKIAITIAKIVSDYAELITPMKSSYILEYLINAGDDYYVESESSCYRVSVKGVYKQALICDRVVDVMLGKVSEVADLSSIFTTSRSLHEFTLHLVASIIYHYKN